MNTIRFIRKSVFKVGQGEFAKIANVAQATVSRWERSESSPTLDEIKRIRDEAAARAIPWSDDWLFRPVPSSMQEVA
ncbi:helix-turn-helix domain-containing protein [Brucella tritici]|uniref:Helix-turn-helix domain-containing protein n=1 Tax=Brucella tritici TaxID=94626 RepID=A0A7V8B1W4_9HYPH|nr:helix-turn-helix domain-containing protein [Brucella tritici]KAB2656293.1 helix-turn-helix domain-containing protein [Brucella tritici]